MKLLLVEDDYMIGEGLQNSLKKSGYSVDWVEDGLDVEPSLKTTEYSLIILDLGLPGKDGVEVLKSLRASRSDIPVLILTARDGIEDRVLGLDIGADDYMIKPFALEELEARIRLLLRRKIGERTNVIQVGDLYLDINKNEVSCKNLSYTLSAKEFNILRLLMECPNKVFSRSQLEERLYGWNEEVESNSVEVHIYQLRQKLGKSVIKNIRGVGYRIGVSE
ncbi:MAG: response regulator [Alphaproteobacteria bacterium]